MGGVGEGRRGGDHGQGGTSGTPSGASLAWKSARGARALPGLLHLRWARLELVSVTLDLRFIKRAAETTVYFLVCRKDGLSSASIREAVRPLSTTPVEQQPELAVARNLDVAGFGEPCRLSPVSGHHALTRGHVRLRSSRRKLYLSLR